MPPWWSLRRRRQLPPNRNMEPLASTLLAWTRASRPGDDFYLYSNGTWAKNTPIPPDKSNYGAFSVLADLSQQRVRDILDAAKD